MSTSIDHAGASTLAVSPDQTFWTDNQRATLKQLGVARATEADLAVFFHQAQRTGLDPFAKQIYMIERNGKQTIQTGIDGFRLIARRTVDRTGESFGYRPTLWCGEDGQWREVWLSKQPPAAAKVVVVRNGQEFDGIALFDSYAGRKKDGELNSMWASQGAHMIAKCAEALALRKAFPQDLSGLYTSDEMAQAENRTSQRVVREPATNQQQPEPSGRDWLGELQDCETREDVVQLWKAAQAHGELTDELKQELTVAGRALPAAVDVVTGELINEGESA